MRPKVAIVAGASGYIGRVLCEELLLQGWSVYGIYKSQESCVDIPCHKRFHTVVSTDNNHYGTLSDFKEADYDTTYGADAYFDLAWDTKNRSNPYKQMICVTETLGLFMGTRLKDLNVRTFVFVSSFLSFGYKHRMIGLTAEDIFYGGGKSFASDMMMAYSGVKDTPVFVEVMLTNVYGPRSNDRFLDKTIDLFMKDHTAKFTSTGEQIYDFVYETDAAKAIIIAATDSPKSGPSWYLVQQHSGINLKAFIRVAHDIIGRGSYKFGEETVIDHLWTQGAREYPNIRELGWEPVFTFVDGIEIIKKRREEKYSWLGRVFRTVKQKLMAVFE